MRGVAVRGALDADAKGVLSAAEGDGIIAGQMLERWLNDFLSYAEVSQIFVLHTRIF
jgi:hypothetical protein